jgi:hypothetical protein
MKTYAVTFLLTTPTPEREVERLAAELAEDAREHLREPCITAEQFHAGQTEARYWAGNVAGERGAGAPGVRSMASWRL